MSFVGLNAQIDTIQINKANYKKGYFVASGLITGGFILNKTSIKTGIRDWIRERYRIPNSKIDDVVQHLPIAMMYVGDFALKNDKKVIGRHTRHLLVTQGLTLGTMLIMKGGFNYKRPSGGSRAFPSGHTSYAFASAAVLYHSFKDQNLWLAYSGYIPAAFTGIYRVFRDKHWVSDIVVGAGIGILFSHLAYHLDIWHSRTDKVEKGQANLQIDLGIGPNGVGLAVKF